MILMQTTRTSGQLRTKETASNLMKIVFMGTPAFAACSLQKLIDDGYDIPLVVTQPDRRGNRNKMILSEVKKLAVENGIETAQPVRIKKDPELIERIASIGPDLIVVAAFGQILPKSVLEIPRLGCINVHGSLLPKLRGASPMQAAVLEGLDESGVTIMRMAYAGIIRKTDGYTSFDEDAEAIERKIRAFIEWPSCYSYLEGLQVKFYKAEVLDEEADGAPGAVSGTTKTSYTINCGRGKLRILEQQLQGKKRMSAGDFMRGHKLAPGDRFGAEEGL